MDRQNFGRGKRPHRIGRWFAAVIMLVEAALGVLYFFQRRTRRLRRIKVFAQGEKQEIHQLVSGEETWRQYVRDSLGLLHDFFIPHHGNDHRPHALRPKSLLLYTVAAVTMKLVVSGALFLYYPTPAQLARIVAQEIVALTNQARQAVGVPPLIIDPVLAASAQSKGEDMIRRDYFAHDGPEGRKPWSWIDRQQYDYVYAGENLAVDFLTADAIHEAFMKSPSHRANIVNGRYQNIGVAVISGKLAGNETELLVQFFGTRRGEAASSVTARQTGVTRLPVPVPPSAPTPVPSAVAAARQPTPAPPAPSPTLEPAASPGTIAGPVGPESRGNGGDGLGVTAPNGELLPADLAGAANEPILVLGAETGSGRTVEMLLTFSNFFLVALAVFLTVALLLNIVIRVRVQHADLLLQSIAVLSLLVAMLLTKFHFVERIGQQLRIL